MVPSGQSWPHQPRTPFPPPLCSQQNDRDHGEAQVTGETCVLMQVEITPHAAPQGPLACLGGLPSPGTIRGEDLMADLPLPSVPFPTMPT